MKKKILGLLIAAALLSVTTAGITGAGAYFTARDAGSQSHMIRFGESTAITENADWNKQVTITNSADSTEAVWVRARAFAGEAIQKQLKYSGENWTGPDADGWYDYQSKVDPGAPTKVLNIQLPDKTDPIIPEAEEGAAFNVVVVYETTPVVNESDSYEKADWNAAVSSTTGGEG